VSLGLEQKSRLRRLQWRLGSGRPRFRPRMKWREPPFRDVVPRWRDEYLRAATRLGLHQFIAFGILPDHGTRWAKRVEFMAEQTK
jgi:hypothetical protein